MGKCKNITRLLADALERRLTAGEWLAVNVHLPVCSGCRNYRKQIGLVRAVAHAMSGLDESGNRLAAGCCG